MIIVFLQLCVTVGVAATFMFVQPLRVCRKGGWQPSWEGGSRGGGPCLLAVLQVPMRLTITPRAAMYWKALSQMPTAAACAAGLRAAWRPRPVGELKEAA